MSSPQPVHPGQAWIMPEEAVLMAANAAPEGVVGTFSMKVRATGSQNAMSYLNSELDYRDQRNLTVAFNSGVAQQLRERLGSDPLNALNGTDILVRGTAFRVKIVFFCNGRASDNYYYQTQVNVSDADQIVVR